MIKKNPNTNLTLELSNVAQKESTQSATFPAQFKSLDEVREFATRQAEASGFGPDEIYAVKMAVDEGFTNIIEHAYGGECQEEIECSCQTNDDVITITLIDCGQSFNPLEVPEPDLESDLDDRMIGGLGMFFIHQLMDEVRYTFITKSEEEGDCNVLTMIKRKKGTD
jgi:serine/threonine-protein kinase RsbW